MSWVYMTLFLALIWCGFSNDFSLFNIIVALLLASGCHWLFFKHYHDRDITFRPWPFICLIAFTIWQLVISSLIVSWEIITPKVRSEPKLIDIPLSCKSDIEKMLLTNLISLTPGTLFVDVAEHKTSIIIHAMFADEPEEVIRFIKEKLEPKVIKVFHYA